MKRVLLAAVVMLLVGQSFAATNVALDGIPTVGTTGYGWVAERAIDGDTGTGYHSEEVTQEHFYELDLDGVFNLEKVELVNRGGYLARLNGSYLTVMDMGKNVIYTSEPIADGPATAVWDNDGAGFEMVRYIKITKPANGTEPLTIMELRAFGVSISAVNIAPVDGAIDILVDKDDVSENSPTLEWAANELVDAGSITGYFVYFGADQAAVGDAVIGDDTMIGNTYMTATTYQHAADLDKDTTYFWRVDTRLQDDPNTITGSVWNFTTELTLPQIVTEPVNTSELVGEDAVFAIEAVDPLGGELTYQWFFDPNTAVEGDETALSGNGADTAELTVPAVEKSDEGNYFCEVYNPRTAVSAAAELSVGELVAYWPFDGSAIEVITGTECTEMGEPVYGDSIVGSSSIELDGVDDYVDVPVSAVAGMAKDKFTISVWVASTKAGQNPFAFYAADSTDPALFHRMISVHLPWTGNVVYYDAGDGTSPSYDRINATAGAWIVDGQWHHAVFTKDSNTGIMSIYFDGALWIQGTGKNMPLGDPTDVVIGTNLNTDGTLSALFKGRIDDMKIYDIALDEYDVAEMYYNVTGETQCFVKPEGDLNDDCVITLADFAILAADWLVCNRIPSIACD